MGHGKRPLPGDAPAPKAGASAAGRAGCCLPAGMSEDLAPGEQDLAKRCRGLVAWW